MGVLNDNTCITKLRSECGRGFNHYKVMSGERRWRLKTWDVHSLEHKGISLADGVILRQVIVT